MKTGNGYDKKHVPCICCKVELTNLNVGDHHPSNGLSFETGGHYGSAFFDPMDGSRIAIAICDECMTKADEEGLLHKF